MDPFFSSRKFDPSELRNTLLSLPTQYEVDSRRNSRNIEVTTEITQQLTPRHVKERTRSYPFSLSAANRQASHRRDHSADDAKQRSKSYTPLSTIDPDHRGHHQTVQPTKLSRKTVRFSLEDYRNKNKKRGEVTSCSSDNSSRYTFTFADKPLPTAPERNGSTSSQESAAGSLNSEPSSSFVKRHSTSGPLKLLTHSFSSSSRRQSLTSISPQTRVDDSSPSLDVKRQSTPTFSSIAAKRQSTFMSPQQQTTQLASSGFVAPRRQSSLAVVQLASALPAPSFSPVERRGVKESSLHVQHKPLPPPPSPQLESPSPLIGYESPPLNETNYRPISGEVSPLLPISDTFSQDLPTTPGKSHGQEEHGKRDPLIEESWMEDISEEDPLVAYQEDEMMEHSPQQDVDPPGDMTEGDLLIELDMPDDETVEENAVGNNSTEIVMSDEIAPRPDSARRFAIVEDVPEDATDEDTPDATFFEDETPEEDTMKEVVVEEDAAELEMTEEGMGEDGIVEDNVQDQQIAMQDMPYREMPYEMIAEHETGERSDEEDLPQDARPEEHELEAGPSTQETSDMVSSITEAPQECVPEPNLLCEYKQEKDSPEEGNAVESEVTESSSQEEAIINPAKAQIMSCQRLTIRSFRTPPILQWSHHRGIRQLGTRYRAIPKHHCEEIVMQITSYIPRRVAVQVHYIRPGWKILRCRLKVPVVLILVPSSRRVPQRVYSLLCVGQGRQPGEEIMAGIDLEKIDRGKRRMRLEADMKFCER